MNSFLGYVGGKRLLVKQILPLIPEHKTYVEAFAGAAWLLFAKEESEVEVLNDINGDLVNLYRIVKYHLEEFCRQFRWLLTARDEYERFLKEEPEALTDIQRAVRFYYLQRNGFGGSVDRFNFTSARSGRPRINLLRLEENLSEAHLRLSRVWIENLPYQRMFEKFDSPESFFYLDPPYWDCEDYYGKNLFDKSDWEKLKDLLSNMKGKFIMSINDKSQIRELFGEFRCQEVKTTYSVQSGAAKKVTELLYMNY
ncbi:MAG TPA: DNA adenine methylase [Candidatus Kapabacteria bacterium]|nr:DNA adenine methylase [Candidatus Kapabacteria bacterium]